MRHTDLSGFDGAGSVAMYVRHRTDG